MGEKAGKRIASERGHAAGVESAPSPAPVIDPRFARGWLVMDATRAYGPYEMIRLASFLTVDHWVFHSSTRDWVKAGSVEALQPVFSGALRPSLEWYYRLPQGKEQGPFARDAIVRRIADHTIDAEALIRHETWAAPRALKETPFAEHLVAAGEHGPRVRMTVDRNRSSLFDRILSHPRRREFAAGAGAVLLSALLVWGLAFSRGEARREEESENNLYAIFQQAGQVPEAEARRLSSLIVSATSGRTFTPQQMNAIMTSLSVASRRDSYTAEKRSEARGTLQRSLSEAGVPSGLLSDVASAFDAACAGARNASEVKP